MMAASILEVLITGDASSLTLALGQASAATQGFSAATKESGLVQQQAAKTTAGYGKTMTMAFSAAKLGVLAFAAVSIKAAYDFNKAFTQIAALTDTASTRIDYLKRTVMTLSAETATSPNELAHAMYFLASAGLTTQQQMDALTATAQGMAVGLGNASDLATITANALNVFSDNGLTATGVMDTLTAAVREGTAEPDAFATALGRVLPIADNAGISFQQVAASLATMSNAGLDVNEGVTSLRAILQSLVAPTAQTESAFHAMGLTVDGVVNSMKQDGLISTLRMVSEAAKANTESTGEYNQMMRHAIPNIRGLAGALNLTGQDAAKVDAIFHQIVNSTGDLGVALKTTAESDAFKVKQAFQEISNTGLELAMGALPGIAEGLQLILVPMQLLLPLASNLLVVWAGYRILKSVTVGLQLLAQGHRAAAASARVEAAAEAEAAGSIELFTGAAEGGTVAASQLAEAQGLAAGSASAAALGVGGFLVALAAAATVGKHQFDSIFQGADDLANQFGITEDAATQLRGAVSGSLMGGDGSNFFHTFADITATSGTKAEEASAAYQKLGEELTAMGVPQVSVNQAFQENIGLLNANRASITPWIAAVRQAAIAEAGLVDPVTIWGNALAGAAAGTANVLEFTVATTLAGKSMTDLTGPLDHLAAIGVDIGTFLPKLKTDLLASSDQTATFSAAMDDLGKSWMDFKNAAVGALSFAPQALSDLSSAAQQAQDQLDSMTSSSTTTGAEMAVLRDTANLTGQDILKAFQDATDQTNTFGKDLLEVSKVGGQAGKDLASSLLESGNVMAAQVIADSPRKLQEQIVHSFGTGETAAETWGTKLTNAIVGPLDTIGHILQQIANKVWGLNIHLYDHGAKKQVDDLGHSLKALDPMTVLEIKTHIYAGSPWPDEALKMHLYDPIKKMGFKQIAGRWTLPLDVAVHSDGIMPHRITDVGSPSTPNYTAAIDAFTSGAGGQVSSVLSKLYPNTGDDKTTNLLDRISHEARQTGKLNLGVLKDLLREQKSAKWVAAWADQAQRAFAQGLKAEKGPPKWYDLATKNVPHLPEGTHGKNVNVRITRPHMDDAMSYNTDYSGYG